VLELLFADDNPITFEEIPLSFKYPLNLKIKNEEEKRRYENLRSICDKVITNRTLPLKKRLLILGKIFRNLENLKGKEAELNMEDFSEACQDFSFFEDLPLSLSIQKKLVQLYAERSGSIREYAVEALRYFKSGEETTRYLEASARLEKLFPNLEIMFEKLLHNYMIYMQFPFSDPSHSLLDEFASLCGVYLFVNNVILGYMAEKDTLADFIDVAAALFRLINHSNFPNEVYAFLKMEYLTGIADLEKII